MKSLFWLFGMIAVAALAMVFMQPVPPVTQLPIGAGLDHAWVGLPLAAGMIVNQQNLSVLFTGYKAAFNTGFRSTKPVWDRVSTLVPSTTSQEKYAWIGQFPRLREWLGDRVVKGISAFDYSIVNKTYESTIGVPRENIEDDAYGVFSPLFQEMGYASSVHPDELIFALMMAGFATVCYDGQYFFDTDHPVGAGIVSNFGGGAGAGWYLLDVNRPLKPLIFQKRRDYALQTMNALDDEGVFSRKEFRFGVDARCNVGYGFWQQSYASKNALDAAAYAAARAAMMAFTSDDLRPLGIMPNLLVVSPGNEGAGRKILLAETDVAGATNPWKGTAELLVVPWLS